MKTFAEKVREARDRLHLNQQQLADKTGVSKRSVAAYETTGTRPRGNTLKRLAFALGVSSDYLLNDETEDPSSGERISPYLDEVREKYGHRAAVELGELLAKNTALFAGGSVNQEAKDAFFEAVMKAYITCKEEAKKAYGRKEI